MLNLSDLISPMTPEQAEEAILAVAVKLGFPVSSWNKGGVARSLIAIVAWVYSTFTSIAVLAIGGGLLEYATAGWLTLLARNVYGVDRIEATFAKAQDGITLSNGGGGLYEFEPGDLTFSAIIGGVKRTYRNTTGGTLSPGPGTTLKLNIQANEIGAGSNAAPGQISTMDTTFLGVTCINEISVLGQDEEKDPALRQRCRDKLGVLSIGGGPERAYRYWAASAARSDGSAIGVTRVRIPTPPGDGSLQVIVATPSGAVPGTVGDLGSDLGIVDDLVQKNAVPTGVGPVTVSSATNSVVDIEADVYIDAASGLTDSDINSGATVAFQSYFPSLPIGGQAGFVFVNALVGIIENSVGSVVGGEAVTGFRAISPFVLEAVVTTPAMDVSLLYNEVPVQGTLTLTIHRVTP